jgi:PD-(D/E)XK nuclease superfamily
MRISGKTLGELALPGCCERCFWIKMKMGNRFPYSIFPGIFASIDSFTKRTVHAFMDINSQAPAFLNCLGAIRHYISPPHHSRFQFQDPITGILLTGEADGIFEFTDNSLAIVDYKTAKWTDKQDCMLPIYQAQLNCYALIAEHLDLGQVSKLALIYMEPLTDSPSGMHHYCQSDGLELRFKPKIVEVERDDPLIQKLLKKADRINRSSSPPDQFPTCKNCFFTESFMELVLSKKGAHEAYT